MATSNEHNASVMDSGTSGAVSRIVPAESGHGLSPASAPSSPAALGGLRFSFRSFSLIFFIGLLLVGCYFWMYWRLQQETHVVHTRAIHLTENVGRIMQLDEVLTMSARMTAATGDFAYERRYRQFEPELDQRIKETSSIFRSARAIENVRQTDVANQKLVAMEQRSFQLTHDGRGAEALALLTSPGYVAEKKIYAEGMRSAFETLQAILQYEEARVRRRHIVSLVLGGIGVLVVFLGWGYALQTLAVRLATERVVSAGSAVICAAAQRFSGVAGMLVAGIGGLALLGWMFDVPFLKSIHPQWVSMKANTALGLMLLATALYILRRGRPLSAQAGWLAYGCAAGAALIGLLTLAECWAGWDLRVDQWLFAEAPGSVGTSHPGRMAPLTASSLVLLGAGLLLLDVEIGRIRPAQLLAIIILLTVGLVIVEYAYQVTVTSGWVLSTRMAVHTAAALLLLACGMLCARPATGLMTIVTLETLGGHIARRLLPAVILIPFGVGWLLLHGQQAGLYLPQLGSLLFVMCTATMFTIVVWQQAHLVHAVDQKRVAAERSLRELIHAMGEFHVTLEEKVAERTDKLRLANKELEEKATRLERFHRLVVGRELEMVRLKQEVDALLQNTGRPLKYHEQQPPDSTGQPPRNGLASSPRNGHAEPGKIGGSGPGAGSGVANA